MLREGDVAESLGTGCSQPGEQRSCEGRNKAQVPAGSLPLQPRPGDSRFLQQCAERQQTQTSGAQKPGSKMGRSLGKSPLCFLQ